ncbi:TPA: accessory Sec system glycosyltransferase Asp1 [Streptococcus suis]|nr:accessory Sec system glycosyltransferase Asp1 [Streptococcus suis]HEM5659397.1 accessory Sec system glycosyltransferase Asp1 [Streptococcus suis]
MKHYFIPSWYPEHRTWYDNTNSWYNMWATARFDDTINQLRMFETAGEENQLLVLNICRIYVTTNTVMIYLKLIPGLYLISCKE